MKTRNLVLMTLAFLFAAIGNAADLPKMSITQLDDRKAVVAYNSTQATPLEITLTASNGDILYFKRTSERHKEYSEVLDFNELGSGNYCICFNYGNQSINRSLSVSGKDITVGPAQHCYEPCFRLEKDNLNISFLNLPQKQVYLSIYQGGQLIDGFKLGKDLAIQKRLDLSNLKNGEYEVVVTDSFKEHKYIAKI